MPAWPNTLPQYFNVAGYSEEPADNTIRTPMETGDIKSRRRFTGQYDIISGAIDMTAAQFETFKAFWRDDLKDGSLTITWVHPTTRANATFRPTKRYAAPVFGVDNRRVQLQFQVK
jgi:hypothetical protein